MKTIEEILLNTTRCTITEEADLDVNENFYFAWNDVISAMKEYAKQFQPKAENREATSPLSDDNIFFEIKDLRPYLIRHPDPEMVRASCLHFLGDKFQKFNESIDIKETESTNFMQTETFTREQYLNLDKETLVTLLMNCQKVLEGMNQNNYCTCKNDHYAYGHAVCFDCGKIKELSLNRK